MALIMASSDSMNFAAAEERAAAQAAGSAIGGDTIHHALGIPAFSGGETHGDDLKRSLDTLQRALEWRWLIVDEISMVNARLLAEIEYKCRQVVRDLDSRKRNADSETRPFGGLNVILAGDMWQLEPPDGTFLGAIPTDYLGQAKKYHPAPTTAHGQSLLWGGGQSGIQGTWELDVVERTDDAWLQELQDEFRNGCLSSDNWNFLHGRPTQAAGSAIGGVNQCGLDCSGEQREKSECQECKNERRRRRRVAWSVDDELFGTDAGVSGTCIFATNNIKYETNKLRAKVFASRTEQTITYAVAVDVPKAKALQKRPDLAKADYKKSWLQRRDRACGNLYGMLPLAVGMPVALTDHVDRSEKALLRGRVGTIVVGRRREGELNRGKWETGTTSFAESRVRSIL